MQKLRRKQSKNLSPSRKITSILEKAEKERDEALFELRKTRSEIQNMKLEIKVSGFDNKSIKCTRFFIRTRG